MRKTLALLGLIAMLACSGATAAISQNEDPGGGTNHNCASSINHGLTATFYTAGAWRTLTCTWATGSMYYAGDSAWLLWDWFSRPDMLFGSMWAWTVPVGYPVCCY